MHASSFSGCYISTITRVCFSGTRHFFLDHPGLSLIKIEISSLKRNILGILEKNKFGWKFIIEKSL